jgi:hypothetical protein
LYSNSIFRLSGVRPLPFASGWSQPAKKDAVQWD